MHWELAGLSAAGAHAAAGCALWSRQSCGTGLAQGRQASPDGCAATSAAVAGAGAGAGALSLAAIACASSESTDTAVTRGADVELAVRLVRSLVVWKVNVAASWAMSLCLTGADMFCAEHVIASPTRAARSSVCILTMLSVPAGTTINTR